MNIWRIICWDLRRVAKDWRASLWLCVMPLVFAFIFGSAFRDHGPQATWIPVIDLDQSALSGLFVDQLREEGYWIEIKRPEDQAALKSSWPYGVVIPAGFGEGVLKGEVQKVSFVKGSGSADRVLEVQSHLTVAILRFTTAAALADISHQLWNEQTCNAFKAALARPQLLTVEHKTDRHLRPPPNGFYQSLPGMLVMFVLQMVFIYGGATLLADRTSGRFARLMAAPVIAPEIYAGKILARVVLALGQSVLLLFLGKALFKVDLGNAWFAIAVIVCFAAFAGSLSALGGMLCKSEKQVVQLAIFASMFLSALGGAWWPIEIVPDLFKAIAHLTPTYWAIHGLQSVVYFNRSYEVLALECPILLGFAALAIAPVLLIARRLTSSRRV